MVCDHPRWARCARRASAADVKPPISCGRCSPLNILTAGSASPTPTLGPTKRHAIRRQARCTFEDFRGRDGPETGGGKAQTLPAPRRFSIPFSRLARSGQSASFFGYDPNPRMQSGRLTACSGIQIRYHRPQDGDHAAHGFFAAAAKINTFFIVLDRNDCRATVRSRQSNPLFIRLRYKH